MVSVERKPTSASCISRFHPSQNINRQETFVNIDLKANIDLAGIRIPDSKLAREIMELVWDTESPLLFHHSSRLYYGGALGGKRRGLRFDPELLYAGANPQEVRLRRDRRIREHRHEVDSANTARDFL